MAHRIIVSSSHSSHSDSHSDENQSAIEYEISFSPPHEMTPAQIGNKVAKILRKLDQIESEPDDTV